MSEPNVGKLQHLSLSSKSSPSLHRTLTSSTPAINLTLAPSELPIRKLDSVPIRAVPYTIFTSHQKNLITLLLGLTTLASPLTATIYFPLIPVLSTHFQTSAQAINLTITVYIIFQALSPAIFATFSDSLGRRPIYLLTFTVYVLASLGLALNKDSYAVLLVLRALQSVGASAVLAIGYGVVADICVPAERGSMLGPVLAATNLGPCIGPVVGGWVTLASGRVQWVFWSLMIFGTTMLAIISLVFPETGRSIVGNGSVPAPGWGRGWWNVLRSCPNIWKESRIEVAGSHNIPYQGGSSEDSAHGKGWRKLKVGNPLTCLRIIFWRDTAIVLWMCASYYAVWYCIQISIPSIYKDVYHFNELEIGLSYLTGGAGVILGGFVAGKLMDRNYKITAKQSGFTINRVSGDDMNCFPIENARSRGSWYLLAISILALGGYGWAVQAYAHPSIPLILQSVIGFICTYFLQTFSALLVDIFPESPSTAAASNNITRCALSAMTVAVLQPLVNALGRGWYFSLLTIVSGASCAAALWAIQTRGKKWRGLRLSNATKIHSIDDSDETGLARRRSMEESDEKVLTMPTALLHVTRAEMLETQHQAICGRIYVSR